MCKEEHKKRSIYLFLTIILVLGISVCAFSYQIDWFTIDGGGGYSSSGNQYSINGTIGQPDAGVLIGGSNSLSGGFWFEQDLTPPPKYSFWMLF